MNEDGVKCLYNQKIVEKCKYFHKDVVGDTSIMTFDNKNCMKNTDTNKMMINNLIAKWYSHPDAKFQTRMSEVYKGSLFQKKGICIQSKKYPMVGIVADYIVGDNHITKVLHTLAISGCTK